MRAGPVLLPLGGGTDVRRQITPYRPLGHFDTTKYCVTRVPRCSRQRFGRALFETRSQALRLTVGGIEEVVGPCRRKVDFYANCEDPSQEDTADDVTYDGVTYNGQVA